MKWFIFPSLLLLLLLAAVCPGHAEVPSPENSRAFDEAAQQIEAALGAPISSSRTLSIEALGSPEAGRGALLHHWRGTLFVPHATGAQLLQLLRDFRSYPQRFAPEVVDAHIIRSSTAALTGTLRLRQHHVLTVVLDATFDTTFPVDAPVRGFSISRSRGIREIASAGVRAERPLSDAENHGFLWRQNTYWSWEERDGGLMLKLETLSLSRSIPTGLGWVVRPFVESIPRESLEFTLRSAARALEVHA